MQKWEYMTINNRLTDKELNEYGAQGWELIIAILDPKDEPPLYLVFKRPKS